MVQGKGQQCLGDVQVGSFITARGGEAGDVQSPSSPLATEGGSQTWPHITPGALHQRGSDGGPRSVILSPSDPRHTLKTMLLQVPPENGLGASFLLMEGGWPSVVGKAQRPKQAVFLGDTHARGKSLSLSLGAFSLSLNSSVNLDTFRMKKFITG